METKVYKPQPGNIALRRIVGAIFAVMGGGMGCLFMMLGLLFVPLLASPEGRSPEAWLLALTFPGAGLLFGLLFSIVGIITFRSGQNDQIELTPELLNLTQGKVTTTLYLADITRLASQWRIRRQRRGRRGHWALLITGRADQTIELAISQGGYLGTFEVLPILQDLIPRLAPAVEIDPRIRDYMATGRIN